ncbi:hypothetical protein [Nocardia farcinica]|uniref:hypothetical protein n=1 Tax=Nocardia farcinica TaxID=37329 RepID=UPI0018936990|nr:hypothetical protein [Nocardia farcinica]MBF6384766.1 hypothetical protein [Nocardia farcinica]MBF6539852.1 hypothetical protein [Nocardia farcinica]
MPREAPGLFPREGVVRLPAAELSGSPAPSFAVIHTDYHVGVGTQWGGGADEFDTVGLAAHRATPEHLDRNADLFDEMGV